MNPLHAYHGDCTTAAQAKQPGRENYITRTTVPPSSIVLLHDARYATVTISAVALRQKQTREPIT